MIIYLVPEEAKEGNGLDLILGKSEVEEVSCLMKFMKEYMKLPIEYEVMAPPEDCKGTMNYVWIISMRQKTGE